MKNCIVKINESYSSLSRQEKLIANYILKHKKEASTMTIVELSKKSKASPATIVRFCNALGFEGYREFVRALYHDAESGLDQEQNVYTVNNDVIETLNIGETINVVSKINIEAIENTLKIISEKEVEKAVDLIDKAKRVKIFALSGSTVVGDDAVFKFERLGIDCQNYTTPHSQILAASIMQQDEVAILISYTGETNDIIVIANYLKKAGCKSIGISRFGENSLSKLVDVNLQHSSIGKGIRTYSTRSRVVQHNIIDILFVALCQRRKKNLKKYYELFKDNPVDYVAPNDMK
ncbi:MAG: MurR/RpiR family transcriptional regulator [Bacilli bacterium]